MQGNCSNSKVVRTHWSNCIHKCSLIFYCIIQTNLVASGENVPVKDMHHIVMVTDLPLIQTLLWEGRAKWYNIGLQLGLSPGTLDAIEQTHHHHTDRCFTATLNEWLTTPKLDRSWNKLAKCLNKKTVGLGELAEQLKLNFGPKNDQ